jgi:hypothetical protein
MFMKLDSLVLRGGAAAAGGLIYSEGIALITSNSRLLNSSSSCEVWQDERDGQIFFSPDCHRS